MKLTVDDCELLDWALGVLTSDYNDAPHEDIDGLRKRLAAIKARLGDFGARPSPIKVRPRAG